MNYTTDIIDTYGSYYSIPQSQNQIPDKTHTLYLLGLMMTLFILLLREPRPFPPQQEHNRVE